MDQIDVVGMLLIESCPRQKEWAEKHGISSQYVDDVLQFRRQPGRRILDALGLEKVTTYHTKSDPNQPRLIAAPFSRRRDA